MNLLFLNACKGLKNKKIQMLGVILLVMLSAGIYTSMNTALDRMEDRFDRYKEEQAVEDFSFDLKIDYDKDFTKEEIEQLKKNELKNLSEEQMQVINTYQQTLGMGDFEGKENLHEYVKYIMTTSGALDSKVAEKVKEAKEKHDFSYKIEKAKVGTEEKFIYKALPYVKNTKINIPYLVDGKMPKEDDEITVLPGFAEKNNLEIGDIYDMLGESYEIVGFAYAPDHIFPLISMNSPMFDVKHNSIIYMTENAFENYSGIRETSYVAKYNDEEKEFDFDEAKKMLEDDEDIAFSPYTVVRKARVKMIEMEIKNDRTFAEYFLYLLLGISIFIIVIITKKRIDDEKLQIGVLKALGYKAIDIATSYLVHPIVGAIVGGSIGYAVGVYLHSSIANLFLSYFNLPLDGYKQNLQYLYDSIGIPLVVLSVLTFLVAIYMLRKKPLELLKEGSNLKINVFTRIISSLTRGMKFENKFKYSLAFRSLGKLFIVTLTSFCSGMLIVLILIGMNLFTSMIDKTFDGMKLDYMVSYANVNEGESKTEDLLFQKTMVVSKIEERQELEKDEEDEEEVDACRDDVEYEYEEKEIDRDPIDITIYGAEPRLRYVEMKHDGKNVLTKLKDKNAIVINYNLKEIYGIDIGDKVTLKDELTNEEITFEVAAYTDSFMGLMAYVNRDNLSEAYGLDKAYNVKYSSDEKYGDMAKLDKSELDKITEIFAVSDLRRNMETQMEASNAIIYVIIAFASFMAFVIISVIANIVVEENKKTISLMKVMGYKNKKISQIVLNIYTPFVIIAYLASIPAMQWILKKIVRALTKDMTFAIPIEFSIAKALIGLLGLLVAYYVSIAMSKKVLNKVPLSIALKRE